MGQLNEETTASRHKHGRDARHCTSNGAHWQIVQRLCVDGSLHAAGGCCVTCAAAVLAAAAVAAFGAYAGGTGAAGESGALKVLHVRRHVILLAGSSAVSRPLKRSTMRTSGAPCAVALYALMLRSDTGIQKGSMQCSLSHSSSMSGSGSLSGGAPPLRDWLAARELSSCRPGPPTFDGRVMCDQCHGRCMHALRALCAAGCLLHAESAT